MSIPYFSPLKLLPFLLDHAPELLFGGLDAVQGQHHLAAFWQAYQQTHPRHAVFSDHAQCLGNVLPVAVHGDEGRGVRKGNTVVVTLESPLGLDTAKNVELGLHHGTCKCCTCIGLNLSAAAKNPISQQIPPLTGFQAHNIKHHSFLTRLLLFTLPSSLSKEATLLHGLIERISMELRQAYFEGIFARGQWWHVGVVGFKGDLAWFAKIAMLNRSFKNLSDIPRHMCHECLAGSIEAPFEDLQEVPAWANSIYQERPWDTTTPPSFTRIPFDKYAPERVLRRDIFHNSKIGIYRDFVASSVLLICELKYFNLPAGAGVGNARHHLLERARNHFRLFCLATQRSAALRTFTKENFNCPTRKSFPWISAKGSDTTLLVEWISVLSRACLMEPLDAAHVGVLEKINATARSANDWMKAMYKHGLWLNKSCATSLYREGRKFLEGYNELAYDCLHVWKFPGFAMKPKTHMVGHTCYELSTWIQNPDVSLLPSPLCWNCESNEDVIGRVSRISRRCHQRRVCARTLEKYVIKQKALYYRLYSPDSLKRKAEILSSFRKWSPRKNRIRIAAWFQRLGLGAKGYFTTRRGYSLQKMPWEFSVLA